MEPLSFKEQIKVYASSQVLIMTHGAALVNILFMPEVGLLFLQEGSLPKPNPYSQHTKSFRIAITMGAYIPGSGLLTSQQFGSMSTLPLSSCVSLDTISFTVQSCDHHYQDNHCKCLPRLPHVLYTSCMVQTHHLSCIALLAMFL